MTDDELATFYGRLEYLARKHNVSVTDLGVLAGLSTDTVSKWIRLSKEAGGGVSGSANAHSKVAARWQVSRDWLQGAAAPVVSERTMVLDSQRDRLWLQAGLIEAGVEPGRASEIALTIQMKDGRSPQQTLQLAKELAGLSKADSKGKLQHAPTPPHPKKPPKVGR